MKQLLITIAALVLVGCGKPQQELNNELIRALDDGKLWRVKKAVDRGAEVNIYKTDKLSLKSGILGKAAKDGHLEIVQFLLESGADVHPEKAPEGVLPIHFAAMGGNEKIVKLLIASKSDVNLADDDGNTVLHFATLWGNKKVVELLIAKGANINEKKENGLTALHLAVINESNEIAELLIEKNADLNVKDKRGYTPLHLAAYYGEKEIAELLIAGDADVNVIKSKRGVTPLDYAIRRDKPKIIELLRKHGAKTAEELKAEGK